MATGVVSIRLRAGERCVESGSQRHGPGVYGQLEGSHYDAPLTTPHSLPKEFVGQMEGAMDEEMRLPCGDTPD